MRNMIGVMKESMSFFKASAKLSQNLKKLMGHSIFKFRLLLSKIVETYIGNWNNVQSSVKAKVLKNALYNSEFLISTICMPDLLSTTIQLSRFLQTIKIDLKSAQVLLNDTLEILYRKREQFDLSLLQYMKKYVA